MEIFQTRFGFLILDLELTPSLVPSSVYKNYPKIIPKRTQKVSIKYPKNIQTKDKKDHKISKKYPKSTKNHPKPIQKVYKNIEKETKKCPKSTQKVSKSIPKVPLKYPKSILKYSKSIPKIPPKVTFTPPRAKLMPDISQAVFHTSPKTTSPENKQYRVIKQSDNFNMPLTYLKCLNGTKNQEFIV